MQLGLHRIPSRGRALRSLNVLRRTRDVPRVARRRWFDFPSQRVRRVATFCTSIHAKESTEIAQEDGYRSIGSFHSDDVEELLRKSACDYTPPQLPELVAQGSLLGQELGIERILERLQSDPMPFGHQLREEHFLIEPEWTFLNHGAFGGAVRVALERATAWRWYSERQPLRYFDRDLLPHLTYSLREVARFVGADPSDIVLTQNATSALNAVLQGLKLEAGDHIFLFDTSYGSVKTIAREVCSRTGATLDIASVPLPLPEDPSDAMHALERIARDHMSDNTKLAIFDHTTSNTAINMPLERLCDVAREKGALTLVDGAHGLMAHELNFSGSLRCADYYVSNCHKWLGSPKGVGFLWAAPSPEGDSSSPATNLPKPLIISHGYDQGVWSGFVWDGCRDYSSALTLPLLLQFWEDGLGLERSRQYMKSTLDSATELLTHAWMPLGGGRRICSGELHGPMALVSLPAFLGRAATSADAKKVQDALHLSFRVEVPVKCLNDELWVRISASVYNEMKDYETLARVIPEICRGSLW